MQILNLLKWVLIFAVAIAMATFLIPVAFLYSVFRTLFKFRIGELTQYFKNSSIAIDQLGNVMVGTYLLNDVLVGKDPYCFGNCDETISGVLGKNKRARKLSKIGDAVSNKLNKIEKDHVEKAIEEDENNN